MKPIVSIPEARAEAVQVAASIQRLRDFLDHFEGVLAQFQALGGSPASPGRSIGTVKISDMPLADRILAIFKDTKEPLMPKDVAAEYERRGWPETESAKLYDSITGSIGYLTKKKKLLVRVEGGYVVANASGSSSGSNGARPEVSLF